MGVGYLPVVLLLIHLQLFLCLRHVGYQFLHLPAIDGSNHVTDQSKSLKDDDVSAVTGDKKLLFKASSHPTSWRQDILMKLQNAKSSSVSINSYAPVSSNVKSKEKLFELLISLSSNGTSQNSNTKSQKKQISSFG